MEKSYVNAALHEIEKESNDLAGAMRRSLEDRTPAPSVASVIEALASILIEDLKKSEKRGLISREDAVGYLERIAERYRRRD